MERITPPSPLEFIMTYSKTLAALVESANTAQAEKLEQMAAHALSLVEKHESGLSPLSPQSLKRCYAVLEVATS